MNPQGFHSSFKLQIDFILADGSPVYVLSFVIGCCVFLFCSGLSEVSESHEQWSGYAAELQPLHIGQLGNSSAVPQPFLCPHRKGSESSGDGDGEELMPEDMSSAWPLNVTRAASSAQFGCSPDHSYGHLLVITGYDWDYNSINGVRSTYNW